MFGMTSPIELVIVVIVACLSIGAPIAIVMLLVRLVAIKEKNDQRPKATGKEWPRRDQSQKALRFLISN